MEESIKPYIVSTKKRLRAGHEVKKSFASVRDEMRREVDSLRNRLARGDSIVPELDYNDIASGSVHTSALASVREAIKKRGCAIIRGVFPTSQAMDWNEEIGAYLEQNSYLEKLAKQGSMDDYFGDLAEAKPQIFGIYWSRPQVLARQAESMAATKRFLNALWDVRAPMGDEFDPNFDYAYADRTRRRAPGDTTLGLSPHMDAGSFERWVDPAFHEIYRPIFSGNWQDFDPWKAAYRTQTREFASPAVCSMFRTFQGWTALTPQGPNDGTLQLLPIANAIAYILLRSLQDDIAEDEFCIARPGRALGIDQHYHPDLMPGLTSIPEVQPGDTVWWHPDLIHAVQNEHNGEEYASVIYIGSSPACGKNAAYARRQAVHFLSGKSAPDFAAEDFETDFSHRATEQDLTELGRRQMGLAG